MIDKKIKNNWFWEKIKLKFKLIVKLITNKYYINLCYY